MTYLLDVNLLIALFDEYHVHHASAHRWFSAHAARSWSTCPLTENAFLRIVGNPKYPNSAGSPALARDYLRERTAEPGHKFWPDSVSLLESALWKGSGQIAASNLSDCYLLALAAHHGGKLATFDRRIPFDLIARGRESLHILT